MSNKVIFNLDELFISVGIDVGADFSWMSIALPNQQFVGKPYKILTPQEHIKQYNAAKCGIAA